MFLFSSCFWYFVVGRVWYCGLGRFKMITFVDVGLKCSPLDVLMKYNGSAQFCFQGHLSKKIKSSVWRNLSIGWLPSLLMVASWFGPQTFGHQQLWEDVFRSHHSLTIKDWILVGQSNGLLEILSNKSGTFEGGYTYNIWLTQFEQWIICKVCTYIEYNI